MSIVSLEVYPQSDGKDHSALKAANSFVPGVASFVSVTCTQLDYEATLALCERISAAGHETAPHLVGAGRTHDEIEGLIERTIAAGYRRIVALRGDVTAENNGDRVVSSTAELVKMLSGYGKFDEIMVGGYPDVHPDARSADSDLRHLITKIEAGATRVVTQFCFDADTLCRFRERLDNMKITVPISAGVLPVRNFAGMLRFARRCKAAVPPSLQQHFANTPTERHHELASKLLNVLVDKLVASGFDIHFYTLNSVTMLNEAWLAATSGRKLSYC